MHAIVFQKYDFLVFVSNDVVEFNDVNVNNPTNFDDNNLTMQIIYASMLLS